MLNSALGPPLQRAIATFALLSPLASVPASHHHDVSNRGSAVGSNRRYDRNSTCESLDSILSEVREPVVSSIATHRSSFSAQMSVSAPRRNLCVPATIPSAYHHARSHLYRQIRGFFDAAKLLPWFISCVFLNHAAEVTRHLSGEISPEDDDSSAGMVR